MNILEKYYNIEENTETLISLVIYDKKLSEVKKYFEDQLEKSKKIINIIKKTKINNRLFSFIKYLNDNYDEESDIILNNVFLIHDKIISYTLSKKEVETAHLYNLLKIYIKFDTKFDIYYILDIFTNFNFIYTIKINKSDLTIIKLNKNKEKELEVLKINNEQKIIENIENIRKLYNYKDLIIIYGNSNLFNKIDIIKNVLCAKELLNRTQLYNLYEEQVMKGNHIYLQKRLDDIKNEKTNLDLYLFGKLKFEIKDAIESYSVKELYIEDKKLEKLKSFVDSNCFNFK